VQGKSDPTSACFRLTFPFCGPEYQQMFQITDSEVAFHLDRWARGDVHTLLITIIGSVFEKPDHWTFQLDQDYRFEEPQPGIPKPLIKASKNQLLLELPAATMDKYKKLLIKYHESGGRSFCRILDLPVLPAAPKPKIDSSSLEVSGSTASFVKLTGSQLDLVKEVYLRKGADPKLKLDLSPVRTPSEITIQFPSGQAAGFARLLVDDQEIPVLIKT
jgi:hypothetical protein